MVGVINEQHFTPCHNLPLIISSGALEDTPDSFAYLVRIEVAYLVRIEEGRLLTTLVEGREVD